MEKSSEYISVMSAEEGERICAELNAKDKGFLNYTYPVPTSEHPDRVMIVSKPIATVNTRN